MNRFVLAGALAAGGYVLYAYWRKASAEPGAPTDLSLPLLGEGFAQRAPEQIFLPTPTTQPRPKSPTRRPSSGAPQASTSSPGAFGRSIFKKNTAVPVVRDVRTAPAWQKPVVLAGREMPTVPGTRGSYRVQKYPIVNRAHLLPAPVNRRRRRGREWWNQTV